MKIKPVCWTLAGLALISIMTVPAFAHWQKLGESPGWWKHQFNVCSPGGTGKVHVSWADLLTWTGTISSYWGLEPPYFPNKLPLVSSLDYDQDGDFDTDDALGIFNDTDWNHMWTPLANWYNWASSRGPVW